MTKSLAIVGSGSETRHLAPFDDPNFDIWVFNEAPTSEWCKRWDACFQLHKPEIYKGHNTKDPNHWQWLQQAHGKPIYMQEVDPLVPDSVRFPLEDAIALSGMRYLTATICDALALAILQGYEVIHLYGVEMSFSEYQYQAECYRYWIGFAKGRLGSENVILHSGEKMFTALLYGYEGNFALGSDYFKARAAVLDAEWQAAEKNLQNTVKAVTKTIERMHFDKLPDMMQAYQRAASGCGEKAGALAEAERYAAFGDRFADRGGFEFAAATAQRSGEEKKTLTYVAIGKAEYVWNVWRQAKSKQAAAQLESLIRTAGQAAYDMGAALGMYQENISYIQLYDEKVRANGGTK